MKCLQGRTGPFFVQCEIGGVLQKRCGFGALGALFCFLFAANVAGAAELSDLRLNEIQLIGAHQSYRSGAPEAVKLAKRLRRSLGPDDVVHPPVEAQLTEAGFLVFDFDIHPDPLGGRYADPVLAKAPFVEDGLDQALRATGYKVMRRPGADYRSDCATLMICLGRLKAWSDLDPAHPPLIVFLEPHPYTEKRRAPFRKDRVEEIDVAALDQLELEIRTVLPRHKLITPDDVRGRYDTLEEAVLAGGWPKLRDLRGRILIALADDGAVSERYAAAGGALVGRSMFANLPAGHPGAAVMTADDIFAADETVTALVEAGYLVRTRADSRFDAELVRNVVRSGAAMASGAQIILTDYPLTDEKSGYSIRFDGGGAARCNPVSAAGGCPMARGTTPVRTLTPLASAQY